MTNQPWAIQSESSETWECCLRGRRETAHSLQLQPEGLRVSSRLEIPHQIPNRWPWKVSDSAWEEGKRLDFEPTVSSKKGLVLSVGSSVLWNLKSI